MRLADLIDTIERDAYDGLSTTAEFAEAHNMAEELEDENAKLRKLCSDMFRDFANCDYELRRHGKTFMAVTRYFDRMQELEVEIG